MHTTNRFTRLSNGVQYRVVTARDVAAERQREWWASPEGKAARAEERMAARRLAPFSDYDKDRAMKILRFEMSCVRAWDIIKTTYGTVRIGDIKLAAMTMIVMYRITAEDYRGDAEGTEGTLRITVYRDKDAPRKLRSMGSC